MRDAAFFGGITGSAIFFGRIMEYDLPAGCKIIAIFFADIAGFKVEVPKQ